MLTPAQQAGQSQDPPGSMQQVELSHVYPSDYSTYFWEPIEIDLDGGLAASVVNGHYDNLDS
eukprot:6210540-Karenia_brevis.AAC.1